MKLKNLIILLALIFALFPVSAALARNGGSGSDHRNEASTNNDDSDDDEESDDDADDASDDDSDDDSGKNKGKGNDNDSDDDDGDDESDDNSDDSDDDEGESNGSRHRSAVATFVQGLLVAADRDGGIGEQVRVIAQEQQDSIPEITDAIEETESRGKFKVFLIGTDYKNIGKIRSSLAQTDNRIARLQALADTATTPEAKQLLDDQIEILQEEQNNLNEFITEQEDTFSLFGWFAKIFASDDSDEEDTEDTE